MKVLSRLRLVVGSAKNTSLNNVYKEIDILVESARKLFGASEVLKKVIASEQTAVQSSSAAAHEISSMVSTTAEAATELSKMALTANQAVSASETNLNELKERIAQVSTLSASLEKSMGDGLKEISSVTTTMFEIRDKAKMINDIVFQTKLLSFNASVEAARAGEHGRGFAVVAEEMGNLAKASGDAAREIENILETAVSRTQEQIKRVTSDLEDVTKKTVGAIDDVSKKSFEIAESFVQLGQVSNQTENKAQEISVATGEQKIGVQQISQALSDLEKSSNQLNSMAEDSHRASADLAGKVESILKNFAEALSGMGFAVPKIEKVFDFQAAISAHIDWKMKLTKYIENPDRSLDPAKVCVDNACILGKWIYGAGQSYEQNCRQTYEALRASHAEFHKIAAHVIQLMHDQKKDEALRVLGVDGPYPAVSERTVHLIEQLRSEVEAFATSVAA